ncbi:hypothetical protein ONZ51_g11874 [Trametes cubensis]|uniref:Pheromone receptor n=1 Tax=Trametes cubensis TaxID=1111947 RepID=A0AAD7X5F4_9APHY|nr:hypothetical protein ONZ51_g11874 [Trametes cubensis]
MSSLHPTYPIFPIVAGLGTVLALIPLPWHAQAMNTGTCYFMIWTALGCLNQFVNSIVWAGNVRNVAPVWCDISTRIIIGASVGIPASALCINIRLFKIARGRSAVTTRAEKRRAILIDSLICVLFPILCMVMAYVVQGHRFNIFEDIGCYPVVYNTLPAYFLANMWPVVIGVISGGFGIMSLRYLAMRRAEFNEFLAHSSSMTSSRYFRLMAMAATELLLSTPLGIYEIYSNAVAAPLEPWKGWADTHFDFSRVAVYPAYAWRGVPALAVPLELSRWLLPACAFIFFAFFGFAQEARKNYRDAAMAIATRIPCLHRALEKRETSNKLKTLQIPSSFGASGNLPSPPPPYMPRPKSLALSSSSRASTNTLEAELKEVVIIRS